MLFGRGRWRFGSFGLEKSLSAQSLKRYYENLQDNIERNVPDGGPQVKFQRKLTGPQRHYWGHLCHTLSFESWSFLVSWGCD